MKKRIMSMVSLVMVLCSILTLPVLAIDGEPEFPLDPIDPEQPYVDIDYYNCYCRINENGRAFCSSYAETANMTYTVYILIRLQRYENGVWQNYAGPWTNTGICYCTTYAYYYVPHGYYYRTGSAVTVRTADGEYVEGAYLFSPAKYY